MIAAKIGKVLGAWCDSERESAFVVLTSEDEIAAIARVAIGERHQVAVPLPELLRPALVFGARSLIFAHTHPSGNLGVSTLDMELTRRILDA
jgi:DNA repair protein RadC